MADRPLVSPEELLSAASAYSLLGELRSWGPHGSGHINDTLCVVFDQAGNDVRYIFQRINHQVFPEVDALMENVGRVTAHVADRVSRDDNRRALQLLPTDDGRLYTCAAGGSYWRLYLFIEGASTHDTLRSVGQAFEAARAFGAFQRLLGDLPGPRLHEIIPGFHDTPRRFQALQAAATTDRVGRVAGARAEIEFAFSREPMTAGLLALAREGTIPERITHNDTKINNVMLDDVTGEALCVIDLDTVMPGLSLYDFGDMVRTAVSPAAEDETDLGRIQVRLDIFEALTRGFAAGVGPILTEAEWENLAFSSRLMTFEVGIRFLTDYLQGDTYFKVMRSDHNLDRCRNQFELVRKLECAGKELEAIVRDARGAISSR